MGVAAAEAIAACTIVEKTVDEEVTVLFEYPFMNDVMRIVKEEEPEILSQSYDMDCSMTLRIRQSAMPRLRSRWRKWRLPALQMNRKEMDSRDRGCVGTL